MDSPDTGRCADVPDELLDSVSSLEDLAQVMAQMHADFVDAGAVEWENATLEWLLEALAAVATDWPGAAEPSWSVFAQILITATAYE